MHKTKRVFIGSSRESKETAKKVAILLEDIGCEVTCWWSSDVYPTAQYTLESILKITKNVDAGLFIIAEDDIITSRKEEKFTVRDNVLIEAGLFFGVLGRKAVALCVQGKPHTPSDWEGITTLPLDPIKTMDIQRRLEIWLSNVPYVHNKKQHNIYMASRNEVQAMYSIDERFGITTGLYKHIDYVRVLNLASNLLINPSEADGPDATEMKKRPVSLSIAIREVLKHREAIVNLILVEPTPEIIADVENKIANQFASPAGAVYSAHKEMYDMICNDDLIKSVLNRKLHFLVTDICLPFAIFNIVFDKEFSYLNHVKIDLYSAELSAEEDRRSMIIWESQDEENYRFFVDNFESIRRSSHTRKPSFEEQAKWSTEWDRIRKKLKLEV